jgi:hypothetical protein
MGLTWSAIGRPHGSNKMPAQLRKNFIGIVSDQTEEQRVRRVAGKIQTAFLADTFAT